MKHEGTPIGVGLIGVGKHGRRYAAHIRDDFAGVLRLIGLTRLDAARAADDALEFGCRAYPDYHALLADSAVEAVIVVVPPAAHVDIVGAAAQAGRPVLLEKPSTVGLAAGRRLLAVLERYPVPVMVAQTLRYNAVVRAILTACTLIGPVHSLALTQRFEPSRLPWLDDPARAGGGMVLQTGVHCFDLLRVLSGREADAVVCQITRVRTQQTEDSFAAAIRMGGGRVLATVSCSRAAGGRTGYIEVAGEKGTLVGDHVAHYLHRVEGARTIPVPLGDPVPTVREVLRDFARALQQGSPVPIPIEEGLRAVAVADACYAAARSGAQAAVERVP